MSIRKAVLVFVVAVLAASALLLALLGAVIAAWLEWLVAVWLGLAAVHAWAAGREASVLETAFGDAYRAYRASTWW